MKQARKLWQEERREKREREWQEIVALEDKEKEISDLQKELYTKSQECHSNNRNSDIALRYYLAALLCGFILLVSWRNGPIELTMIVGIIEIGLIWLGRYYGRRSQAYEETIEASLAPLRDRLNSIRTNPIAARAEINARLIEYERRWTGEKNERSRPPLYKLDHATLNALNEIDARDEDDLIKLIENLMKLIDEAVINGGGEFHKAYRLMWRGGFSVGIGKISKEAYSQCGGKMYFVEKMINEKLGLYSVSRERFIEVFRERNDEFKVFREKNDEILRR